MPKTKKTIAEQRATIKEKMEALLAKDKELAAREKSQERKARTKRLIELGAKLEKICGKEYDYDKFFVWLEKQFVKKPQTQEPEPQHQEPAQQY